MAFERVKKLRATKPRGTTSAPELVPTSQKPSKGTGAIQVSSLEVEGGTFQREQHVPETGHSRLQEVHLGQMGKGLWFAGRVKPSRRVRDKAREVNGGQILKGLSGLVEESGLCPMGNGKAPLSSAGTRGQLTPIDPIWLLSLMAHPWGEWGVKRSKSRG